MPDVINPCIKQEGKYGKTHSIIHSSIFAEQSLNFVMALSLFRHPMEDHLDFIHSFDERWFDGMELKDLEASTLEIVESKSFGNATPVLKIALQEAPLSQWIKRYPIFGDDRKIFGFYASLMLAIVTARGPDFFNYDKCRQILIKLAFIGRKWEVEDIETLIRFVAIV